MSSQPLLSVDQLSVEFRTRNGVVRALDKVSIDIGRGEMVAVVGESGSGKSVTAYALMGILDPAGRVTNGTAMFEGLDLLKTRESDLRAMRGSEISMIFQNPRVALNPIRRVGQQIADVLIEHGGVTRRDAAQKAIEMLAKVRIPDPERRARAYPFELSGGMCQRIMIAIALACNPRLLIADEPTTGLDVTTQAVIMDLIADMARGGKYNSPASREAMSTLLITHDLGMAAEYCDRIVVMHAGHVVEAAATSELFRSPRHPYTARLISATPRPGTNLASLVSIPGGLPDLRSSDLPPCRYSARCERKVGACDAPLQLLARAGGGSIACQNPL